MCWYHSCDGDTWSVGVAPRVSGSSQIFWSGQSGPEIVQPLCGLGITIGTQLIQMDVWTAVDNDFPCQISITDIPTRVVTTWAFDGFGTTIPPEAINQCSAPKILCTQANWVCISKPGTDPSKLLSALQWVCDPTHLDCSPIQPGGDHYIPNTLPDHCNWAFNAYFLLHRASQGLAACDFGGTAQFVAPSNATVGMPAALPSVLLTDLFSNNLICERTK